MPLVNYVCMYVCIRFALLRTRIYEDSYDLLANDVGDLTLIHDTVSLDDGVLIEGRELLAIVVHNEFSLGGERTKLASA